MGMLTEAVALTLQNNIRDGTITSEDTSRIINIMKRESVLKDYVFPSKASSDGYYHISVKDVTKKNGRRQLKAKTLSELKDKTYFFLTGQSPIARNEKTFNRAFKECMDEKLKYVKKKERLVSVKNSVSKYQFDYNRFFKGTAFEAMKIDDISAKDIENIVYMNLERYSLKKKSALAMRTVLSITFKYAYNAEWIKDNPYLRANFKKFTDMIVSDTPLVERAHSAEDVQRIINVLHEYNKKKPDYIPAYALECQIYMGARRGEIPPLTWDDIRNGCIFVHKELLMQKKFEGQKEQFVVVDHTKTNKDRNFPITNDLADLLERLQKVHDTYYEDSKYLFPADNENGCITTLIVYQLYKRICDKLGLKISKEAIKGTHSFRRNAITTLVNRSGGNLIMAAKIYGNSPEVIENNYFTQTDLDRARSLINGSPKW